MPRCGRAVASIAVAQVGLPLVERLSEGKDQVELEVVETRGARRRERGDRLRGAVDAPELAR